LFRSLGHCTTSPQNEPTAERLPDVAYLISEAESENPVHPDLLDGTLSALVDLEAEEGPHTSFLRRPSVLDLYFAWKAEIRRQYLFSFGGSWGVLWQNYTNSRIGQPNAVGSKLTINLSYDLFNRRKPSALSFDMAVEDRRALGTALPPLFAGLGAGSAVPTAATWGQFDMGITQAYIRQSVFSNRFQYTVGKIFAPNFIIAYPFFDDNRQFLSQQFSTSPTIPSPQRGFGLVGAWFPSASNGLYIKPGMFTTYSSDTGSTISDFFTKSEHFYMLEVGLTGLAGNGVPIQARGPMDANNIHITGWYRNPLPNSSPRSYGFAFNANRMYGANIMCFCAADGPKVFYPTAQCQVDSAGALRKLLQICSASASVGRTLPKLPSVGSTRPRRSTASTYFRTSPSRRTSNWSCTLP